MKVLAVLCAVAALASAKPYAFTEVAPLTGVHYGALPYSYLGAQYPLAYSAIHTPFIGSPIVSAPVVSAPVVAAPVVAPAVGLKTQYHAQDIVGQASYGHVEPHQSHTAVQDAAGNKVGSFSYVKPDGTVARTDYVADALGYRVASNDLPVGPAVNPLPVVDTPEVVAARAAHLAEVEKVRSRTRRQAILPASTSPLVTPYVHAPLVHAPVVHAPLLHTPLAYSSYWSHGVPVVTPSGHLADTPEVAAAKIAHFAEHAKAAARAKRQVLYTAPVSTVSTVAVSPFVRTIPTAYGYTAAHAHHVPLATHQTVHYAY